MLIAANTITTTSANFTFSQAELISIVGLQCDLRMFSDGINPITPQQLSLEVDLEYDNRGYAHEKLKAQLIKLEKDGGSREIKLLLNPDSQFQNFVRVSNLGSAGGTFTTRLFDDSGKSVSFAITDSFILGGASSRLIPVRELYQKATEIDPLFNVGQGNLRAVFDASFDPLDVQNIIVSSDGTTFNRL